MNEDHDEPRGWSKRSNERGSSELTPRRLIKPAAILSVVSALFAAEAGASPASRLVYSRGVGAESCADESALRAAVATRLGYDPFFPWAPITVVAQIRRERGALRG